jgi:hypothetical protein
VGANGSLCAELRDGYAVRIATPITKQKAFEDISLLSTKLGIVNVNSSTSALVYQVGRIGK